MVWKRCVCKAKQSSGVWRVKVGAPRELRYTSDVTDDTFFGVWMSVFVVVHLFLCTSISPGFPMPTRLTYEP